MKDTSLIYSFFGNVPPSFYNVAANSILLPNMDFLRLFTRKEIVEEQTPDGQSSLPRVALDENGILSFEPFELNGYRFEYDFNRQAYVIVFEDFDNRLVINVDFTSEETVYTLDRLLPMHPEYAQMFNFALFPEDKWGVHWTLRKGRNDSKIHQPSGEEYTEDLIELARLGEANRISGTWQVSCQLKDAYDLKSVFAKFWTAVTATFPTTDALATTQEQECTFEVDAYSEDGIVIPDFLESEDLLVLDLLQGINQNNGGQLLALQTALKRYEQFFRQFYQPEIDITVTRLLSAFSDRRKNFLFLK